MPQQRYLSTGLDRYYPNLEYTDTLTDSTPVGLCRPAGSLCVTPSSIINFRVWPLSIVSKSGQPMPYRMLGSNSFA